MAITEMRKTVQSAWIGADDMSAELIETEECLTAHHLLKIIPELWISGRLA